MGSARVHPMGQGHGRDWWRDDERVRDVGSVRDDGESSLRARGSHQKGRRLFCRRIEKRSGSESGWRRARVFALVAGAKPRVELRRGSLVGLSAEEAEEARPAVADAVVRAVDVAKAKSGFLPFRNCFEVYATTLDVRRKSDGKWEARATRFEDAFESPSCFVAARGTEEDSESESAAAEDAEEDSESESAAAEDAEEDSESDSALAETPSSPRSNSSIRGNSSLRRRRGRRAVRGGSRVTAIDDARRVKCLTSR